MTALPFVDQPPVRPAHIALALDCSEATLIQHLRSGKIPQPDARGQGCLKLWKVETIRAWNPAVADAVEQILALPAFAPRPTYFPKAA